MSLRFGVSYLYSVVPKMRDRRPDRIVALTDVIAGAQLDGLLLSSPANIRYLTSKADILLAPGWRR